MKYILFILSVLHLINSYGQGINSGDQYDKARQIINDLDSIVAPNGIQENYEAKIGGIKQWVYVRGQNKNNPIILFVHGGPASPMSPVMWMFQRPFEEYFTVINYDQRASGKTYASNDTAGLASTIHINQYVDDAIELNSIAPYPGDKPITRERIIIARKWAQYYGGLSAYRRSSAYYFRAPLLSPVYTKDNITSIDDGNVFTLGKVLDEFLNVDFKNVKSFPIPVFMFMGRHDYTTPSEPTAQWLQNIKAPLKKGIWFENSAHLLPLEEPGKMLVTLLNEVKPLIGEKSK